MIGKIAVLLIAIIILALTAFLIFDLYDMHTRNVNIISAKNIVGILLNLLGLLGFGLKKELGWVLTSILLYSLLIAWFTLPFNWDIKFSFGYASAFFLAAIPIVLMNSRAVVQFFRLKNESGFVRRNLIALAASIIAAVLMLL